MRPVTVTATASITVVAIDTAVMPPPRRRTLRLIRAAALVAVVVAPLSGLTGCGFKLRGSIDMPFKTLYVPNGNTAILADLRRALGASGSVRLVDKPDAAEARLETLTEAREKEILAFSSTGTPREYQLRLRFRFRLLDDQQDEWIPPSEIVLRRNVTTTDQQLLAKQQEDVLLYQEMQSDLVQQMLRRLAAAKR